MSHENDENVRLTSREDMMIRLVNRQLTGEVKESQCLSDGDLAAFMDGTLDPAEMERAVGHLSACGDCYGILSESIQTVESVKKRRTFRRRSLITFLIPSAVAASVLFFLVADHSGRKGASPQTVNQVAKAPLPAPVTANSGVSTAPVENAGSVKRKEDFSPPTAAKIAGALEKAANPERLVDFLDYLQPSQQGFSGGISRPQSFFRAGMELTDLEVAIRGGDRGKSMKSLKRLVALFKSTGGLSEAVGLCSVEAKKIESGSSLTKLTGSAAKIESLFTGREEAVLLSFGSWVEGGRIAAHFSEESYFSVTTVRYFLGSVKNAGAPPVALKPLVEIGNILAGDAPDERKLQRIESLLESVRDLM